MSKLDRITQGAIVQCNLILEERITLLILCFDFVLVYVFVLGLFACLLLEFFLGFWVFSVWFGLVFSGFFGVWFCFGLV